VTAIALALGSSACYGVSNFIGPQLTKRATLVSVLVVSQLAALAVTAIYLAALAGPALSLGDAAAAGVAGLGNALGLIGFYKAAELGPLSIAAPIGALGAVIPVCWGIATGDDLSAGEAVGLTLALAGGALVARRAEDPEERGSYRDPRASVLWATGSAIAFGVFLTAFPEAASGDQAWALFDARLALIVVLALWAGRELATVRLDRGSARLTIPGLLLVAGTILYMLAAEHGDLAIVSVLGSLFAVFTVGLSIALLDDRLSSSQGVGMVAAFAGIALIASG
jgi:drug/metabolite transporter (DMT)-like permease